MIFRLFEFEMPLLKSPNIVKGSISAGAPSSSSLGNFISMLSYAACSLAIKASRLSLYGNNLSASSV